MDQINQIYKNSFRSGILPSCKLDLDYFRKIARIVQELSNEAAEYEIATLKRESFKSEDLFNNAKKQMLSLYRIQILMRTAKGETIISQDVSIFDEENLPDYISYISMDSSSLYEFTINRRPHNSIKIDFDFSKPQIFDLKTKPSLATINSSQFNISGKNETWVQGSYKRILSSIEAKRTNRSWLHKNNIYDLILWFFYMPTLIFNLVRYEKYFAEYFQKIPAILEVFVYIYLFIISLFIFLILFKYMRWIFPYIEIKTTTTNSSTKHRYFLSVIIGGIFLNLISNLIWYLC